MELLNQDLFGEHDAILHYLQHAWALQETYGSAIESIARDEMRHFKWLAHAIVQLGGRPDLRVPEAMPPESGRQLLEADIAAESVAIDQYHRHREAIGDPQIRELLGRIVVDEEDHRRQFRELLAAWDEENPWVPELADADPAHARLQQMVGTEYRSILNALWRSFMKRHLAGVGMDWEDRAVDEMKHLGWLGEAMARHGLWAAFPSDAAATARQLPAHLQAREQEGYERLKEWAETSDPELRPLIDRIEKREAYQQYLDYQDKGFTLGPLDREK